MPIRILASHGTNRRLRNTSKIREREFTAANIVPVGVIGQARSNEVRGLYVTASGGSVMKSMLLGGAMCPPMIFAGIKNEQQAKDIWAYLRQFDAQGNVKK
jgi:hypothetical protein